MSQPIKLLILEDNSSFRESFLALAKKHGLDVVGLSGDAKDLLAHIKEKNPDVLILDLVIPQQNALELITNIKAMHPKLPVIACSSLTEDYIVAKVLKAGCFDYIFKPFKEEDFVASVKKAVA